MNQLTLTIFLTLLSIQFAKADNFNVTSNAVGNIVGLSNLEFSTKFLNHYTIGIRGTNGIAKLADFEVNGSSYGIIARRYFIEALQNDSWFLGATVDKENFKITTSLNNIEYSAQQNKTFVSAGGGYHWFWNSFNISFAVYGSNKEKLELYDENQNKYKDSFNSNLGLELNIGGKF